MFYRDGSFYESEHRRAQVEFLQVLVGSAETEVGGETSLLLKSDLAARRDIAHRGSSLQPSPGDLSLNRVKK